MKLLKYDRDLVVNEEVRQLQHDLNAIRQKFGCDWEELVPDGRFGRRTRSVVRAFQTFICTNFIKIAVDGIVGPETRESIFYCLNTHMIPHKSVVQASTPPAASFNKPKTEPKQEQPKFSNGPSRTVQVVTNVLDGGSAELSVISEGLKVVSEEGGRLGKVGKVLGPIGNLLSIASIAIDINESGEVKPSNIYSLAENIPGIGVGMYIFDKGYAISSEYIWGEKNPKTFTENIDEYAKRKGWDGRLRDDSPNNDEKNNNQY